MSPLSKMDMGGGIPIYILIIITFPHISFQGVYKSTGGTLDRYLNPSSGILNP